MMSAATVRCEICKTHFYASTIEEVMDELNLHREEAHGISRKEVEDAAGEPTDWTYIERKRRERQQREENPRMNWTEYDLEMLAGMRISAE